MSEVKHYLYRIQPTRAAMLAGGLTPEEEAIASEHFAYLKRLTGEGVVILAGRTLNTDETSFGIIVLKADSEQDARDIMNNDPGIKQRLHSGMLFPYRVALIAEANV